MLFGLPSLKAASDELLHLDFVRFVASLGIVFHHSHEFFYDASARTAIVHGSAGLALFVDLFFLISGYVIAHVYRSRVGSPEGILRFLQRRCGRLVPLHWLTLILSIALWGIASHFTRGAHQPDFSISCIMNTAFLLHAVIPCGNNIQFNSVTWSISAEMSMYLLFPIIAWVGNRWKYVPLISGFIIFTLLFVLTYHEDLDTLDLWTQIQPVLRALPAFLIGAGLSYSGSSLLRRFPAPPVLLGVSLLLLALAMLTGMPDPIELLLIYLVAVSAIACDTNKASSRFIETMAPFGQLTYSIYMWHSLFIFVILNVIGDKLLHARGLSILTLTAFCYAAIFIWGYISFIYIETPARRWVDGLFKGHRQIHGLAKQATPR